MADLDLHDTSDSARVPQTSCYVVDKGGEDGFEHRRLVNILVKSGFLRDRPGAMVGDHRAVVDARSEPA